MFRIILQNAIRTFTDNPVDLENAYKFEFISIKTFIFYLNFNVIIVSFLIKTFLIWNKQKPNFSYIF